MKRSLLAIAALIVAGTVAFAAEPVEVGVFQKWKVYTSAEATGKMCFVASVPSASKYSQPVTSRDPVFFMVTSIPAKSIRNEVSTIMGYAFGPNATVNLDIDGNKFTMFTSNTDTAWAIPEKEVELINAMRAGANLTVSGTSKRGTVTSDTYSLIGITAALQKLATECP